MIRYYIAYSFKTRNGFGTASTDFNSRQPIRDFGDIAVIRDEIARATARDGYSNILVLSFSQYAETGETR
jgi:hypothetical protein